MDQAIDGTAAGGSGRALTDERPPGRPDGLSIAKPIERLKSLGENPRGGRAHQISRIRHGTMRHQTTSFQLLKHFAEDGSAAAEFKRRIKRLAQEG